MYAYRAFGLNLASCLPFPELPETVGSPDVVIRYGAVPEHLPDAVAKGVRFQASRERMLLRMDGVARYLVVAGREIVVDRQTADDGEVRYPLLGSVLAALLHQRGYLLLHASAIQVGEGCVAFMGRSGVGKSTLAALFYEKGYPVVTDDVCAVAGREDGLSGVYPGYPHVKLWGDVLGVLSVDGRAVRPVRANVAKYYYPTGPTPPTVQEAPAERFLPLRRVYLLRPNNRDEIRIEPLDGPGRMMALRQFTFRKRFLEGAGRRAQHFEQIGALAAKVPVFGVERPLSRFVRDELVTVLEQHLSAV